MPAERDALPAARGTVVAHALEAFDALVELGETVEDEWTYVTDLAAAGRAAIRAAEGDPFAALPAPRAVAIESAAEEIGRIRDPHRAIDWMSTYPAVIALALAAEPAADRAAEPGPSGA